MSILGLDEMPVQKTFGMATLQQYGEAAMMCKAVYRTMWRLPGHVNLVVIAQEEELGDEDAEDEDIPTIIGPALGKSLGKFLRPMADYVLHTFKKGRTKTVTTKVGSQEVKTTTKVPGADFCVHIGPHDRYFTGFRTSRRDLPEYLVNPTYEEIVKYTRPA
jgi:hypothetical protein